MIVLSADLSGIGNWAGAVAGLVEAVQDPRTHSDFLGHVMNRTREAFYVDSLAAKHAGSARIQHVYEWGSEQGEVSDIRLFNLIKGGKGSERYMSFEFLPSTVPVPLPDPSVYGFPPSSKKGKTLSRHVFRMKAIVMETQNRVIIRPKAAKGLFIPDANAKKGFHFVKGAVAVNPGGNSTGGFAEWWGEWFAARAPEIAAEESKRAEEIIAATGQKVIRYAAGTKIGGRNVGGQFATGSIVSYGNIDAAKATAYMESKNTFQRVWNEDTGKWEESY